MESLPVGAVIERDGVRLRHLGGGQFEPVGEPLEKRFSVKPDQMTAGMRVALERQR